MILMDDQEVFLDDIVKISPLEELSYDLLSDCISDQLKSPYNATTNFLEEFHMMHEDQMNCYQGDDDAIENTKKVARTFYIEILRVFDKKFNLELDWNLVSDMNIEGLRNLSEGIYEFFVTKYPKQVSKCITKIILDNIEALLNDLRIEETDNVSTDSYIIKLQNSDYAFILSNLNKVVDNIKNIPMMTEDFIKYFNQDKFEIAVIEFAIRNYIITGDFIPKYLYPIYSELQDDVYDSIVSDIHERLFQKFKKVTPISLKDVEDTEEQRMEEENKNG